MQQQANDSPASKATAPAAPAPAAANANRGRGGARGGGQAILYDCDFGRDIDTILALAVLQNLGAKGRLAAIGISNSNLESAAFCDALTKFYAGESSAPFGGRGGLIVGLSETGPKLNTSAMIDGPLAMKNPEGKPVFRHGIDEFIDTAEPVVVFRNALSAQRDGEAIFVLAGPATDLVQLLALNRGRELVTSKVGLLVVAAGSYPAGSADPRILADKDSARHLFATWPSPIVAVGTEVGAAIPFPGESIEKDFSPSPAHPVAEAYRANRPMPYDAQAQAVIAALYAGNRSEDYFRLSEPGSITVLDDGRTQFTPSPGGKHRYLLPDMAQKEQIVNAFTTLASAKPAAPPGRGGRGGRGAFGANAAAAQTETK